MKTNKEEFMYKKAQNPVVVTIVMIVLAVALIGGFFLARHIGEKNRETRKSKTEVEKLMELDLDENYPGTAREVLKINNRLMKCYYNEELTDEQIKALAMQNQKLFDEELLKRNPYDVYVGRLKKEIESVNIIEKNKTLKRDPLSLSLYVPNTTVKNKKGKSEYLPILIDIS